MEDLLVGAEIVLKVVETEKEECNGCFFYELANDIYIETCKNFVCSNTERKDGKNVQFKRVK